MQSFGLVEERFSDVLRAARERCGVTRAELARRCGVKPPVVTRWESGASMIGEATVQKYAAALGLRVRLAMAG